MCYVYVIQHISGKKYFTSSYIVKNLIKKDGVESFSLLDIRECSSIIETLDLEHKMLSSISKNARSQYLNMNFSAGGAVIKSQTHISISDGTTFKYIPKDHPIPEGWERKYPGTPPCQMGKKNMINPNTMETKFCFPETAGDGFVIRTEYYNALKEARPKKNMDNRRGYKYKGSHRR